MHLLHILIVSLVFLFLPGVLSAANTEKLTVFYTNDVHGETEPCG